MKPFNKSKALQKLNISQIPYDPFKIPDSHGYANVLQRKFAVNPKSPHPGAAGFHELAHIVLEHWRVLDYNMRELEASAVCMLCLKELGLTRGFAEAMDHFKYHAVPYLPSNFETRVKHAARVILAAGKEEI